MTEENAGRQTERRILVLGSAPHTRLVTAYTWDNLPRDLNVADYDVVILNMIPFTNREFAQGIDLDTLPSWRQFARLLFSSESEVIVVGAPGTKIGDNPYRGIAWWLPAIPKYAWDGGEEIRNVSPEFEFYFQHVSKWFFHFTGAFEDPQYLKDYLKEAFPVANSLLIGVGSIAQTRFERPISSRMRFLAFNRSPPCFASVPLLPSGEWPTSGRDMPSGIESGDVIWLTPTTEIPVYDAIDLILQERYGLCLEQAAPDWVEPYKLPSQLPIEGEIAQLEQNIQDLTTQLAAAQQRLEEVARFQKLLHEQGKEALEPVVREALRELGALVDDPVQPGGDDGRLVDPSGRKYTLEIKGRTGALKLDDVRQLRQWVDDATLYDDWQSKGLLIANLRCGDPPRQRDKLIPKEQARVANDFGQCIVTTTQLFRALCDHQRNELDVVAFWDTMFGTDGICHSLPEAEKISS